MHPYSTDELAELCTKIILAVLHLNYCYQRFLLLAGPKDKFTLSVYCQI